MVNDRNTFKRISSLVCCFAAAMAFFAPLIVANTAQATEERHVVRFGSNNDKIHEMRGFREEQDALAPQSPVENKVNDSGYTITPPSFEMGGPPPALLDISKPGDFGFNFHLQQSRKSGILSRYNKNMKVMRMEKDYFGVHMIGDGTMRTRTAVGLSWNIK